MLAYEETGLFGLPQTHALSYPLSHSRVIFTTFCFGHLDRFAEHDLSGRFGLILRV